jgi:dinuclear metal center YbgI/SA1388 family protein
VIAAHTNVDVARDGTNAQLLRLLGLELIGPLESESRFSADESYLGMGLVGRLPRALSLETFTSELKPLLGGAEVRITGDLRGKIEKVAICSGSGGSLMGKVLASGADVFVTGDMKYHDGRLAEESGIAVIDIGHFASEILVLEPMAAFLRTKAAGEGAEVEVFTASSEKDPFQVIA